MKTLLKSSGKELKISGPLDQKGVFELFASPKIEGLRLDRCAEMRTVTADYFAYVKNGDNFEPLGNQLVMDIYGIKYVLELPPQVKDLAALVIFSISDIGFDSKRNKISVRPRASYETVKFDEAPAITTVYSTGRTIKVLDGANIHSDAALGKGIEGLVTLSLEEGTHHGSVVYDHGSVIATSEIWRDATNSAHYIEID